MFSSITKYVRRHKILATLAVVIAGGLLWFFYSGEENIFSESIVAERGKLVQEVNVTGRVKPAQRINLAFEKTGKVAWVNVRVGDSTTQGVSLVGLQNSDIQAQLDQAEAVLLSREAKLNELRAGTRVEEIQVQEVKVANAKKALEDSLIAAVDTVEDIYTKADDAIRNKIDQFFSSSRGTNPKLNLNVADTQLKTNIETNRFTLEEALNSWNVSLLELTTDSNLSSYFLKARSNLDSIVSFLNDIAYVVNGLEASSSLSQATIDGYRADVATARTNINTAVANLSAAEEELRDSESALLLAEEELALKHAGTRVEEIFAQEASVREAEASVANYRAQLAKTILTAPISGTVTAREADVGEIVAANATVVSLISGAQFEIEANVSEIDVAKLEVGDEAEVTLDAYGSDVLFKARIVTVDPAEVIIEGVPTYKTTFQFLEKDTHIRSGMTADIDIVTEEKESVIAVPQRAVLTEEGRKFVRVIENGAVKDRVVETGIRGSDGTIEIVSGIGEGDEVVTFLGEN